MHQHANKYNVTVATSDGLEQVIIRGKGCALLSARELRTEIERVNQNMLENYQVKQGKEKEKNYLLDSISEESVKQLEAYLKDEN